MKSKNSMIYYKNVYNNFKKYEYNKTQEKPAVDFIKYIEKSPAYNENIKKLFLNVNFIKKYKIEKAIATETGFEWEDGKTYYRPIIIIELKERNGAASEKRIIIEETGKWDLEYIKSSYNGRKTSYWYATECSGTDYNFFNNIKRYKND